MIRTDNINGDGGRIEGGSALSFGAAAPIGDNWFKTTYSSGCGECVKVRLHADHVLMGDTKYEGLPDREPTIAFSHRGWRILLDETQKGLLPTGGGSASSTQVGAGGMTIEAAEGSQRLIFDAREWSAFQMGVVDNQFDLPL